MNKSFVSFKECNASMIAIHDKIDVVKDGLSKEITELKVRQAYYSGGVVIAIAIFELMLRVFFNM